MSVGHTCPTKFFLIDYKPIICYNRSVQKNYEGIKTMKKQAFSLYETLITMAILGVVTALTLPSLMRMHQESSVGPMLSKVQTTIEDGVEKLILDDPYTALKDIEVVTKIQDFIIKLHKGKQNSPSEYLCT